MALTLTITHDPPRVKPGQGITFYITAAVDFVPTDATSPLSLVFSAPNGTTTSVTVQHDGVGQYHGDTLIPFTFPPGPYVARVQDQGTPPVQPANDIAIAEDQFFVDPLLF